MGMGRKGVMEESGWGMALVGERAGLWGVRTPFSYVHGTTELLHSLSFGTLLFLLGGGFICFFDWSERKTACGLLVSQPGKINLSLPPSLSKMKRTPTQEESRKASTHILDTGRCRCVTRSTFSSFLCLFVFVGPFRRAWPPDDAFFFLHTYHTHTHTHTPLFLLLPLLLFSRIQNTLLGWVGLFLA